jgi:hypothetical protein
VLVEIMIEGGADIPHGVSTDAVAEAEPPPEAIDAAV